MFSQAELLICFFLLTLTLLVIFSTKFFSLIDETDNREKNSLDGLRFYLASLVVVHHFLYNYFYITTGKWEIVNFNVVENFGRIGVGFFFMLSAYLFSNINVRGVNWWKLFFFKRIFRITPVCFLTSLICVLIAFFSKYTEHVFIAKDAINLLFWFDGGLINYRPDLFGFENSSLINSNVTWTLHWEWVLYLSLPIISFFSAKLKFFMSLMLGFLSLLLLCFLKYFKIPYLDTQVFISVFFFSIGFIAGHFKNEFIKKVLINKCFVLVNLILLMISSFFGPLSPLVILMCSALLFLSIVNGSSLFGILNLKAAKRLGDISYSVYLMHGIIWFLLFHLSRFNSSIIPMSIATYFLIFFISVIIYISIEFPIYNFFRRKGEIFFLKSK